MARLSGLFAKVPGENPRSGWYQNLNIAKVYTKDVAVHEETLGNRRHHGGVWGPDLRR